MAGQDLHLILHIVALRSFPLISPPGDSWHKRGSFGFLTVDLLFFLNRHAYFESSK